MRGGGIAAFATAPLWYMLARSRPGAGGGATGGGATGGATGPMAQTGRQGRQGRAPRRKGGSAAPDAEAAPEELLERRLLALMVLLALWLAAGIVSVMVLLRSQPLGPGLSPMQGFLGWQGVAGMLGFGCWGIGMGFPRGSPVRRVAAIPLAVALALVLVMVLLWLPGR